MHPAALRLLPNDLRAAGDNHLQPRAEGNPLSFQLDVAGGRCALLYLTVFGTVAAFWLYYWLLSKSRIDQGDDDLARHAVARGRHRCGYARRNTAAANFLGGLLIIGSIGLIVFRKKNVETQRPDATN